MVSDTFASADDHYFRCFHVFVLLIHHCLKFFPEPPTPQEAANVAVTSQQHSPVVGLSWAVSRRLAGFVFRPSRYTTTVALSSILSILRRAVLVFASIAAPKATLVARAVASNHSESTRMMSKIRTVMPHTCTSTACFFLFRFSILL